MRLLYALVFDLFALLAALLIAPLRWLTRKEGWLAAEIAGDPLWRPQPRRFLRPSPLARRGPLAILSIEALARALELAEADPRVRGIVLRIEGFQGPGSKLEAIARLLARFRKAGKQVAIYGRAVSMREYALMAAGSRVFVAPGGRIDLKGYAADLFVLGGTLERLGVKAQFLRRAEHKTAPELFTDREVSPAQKEATRAILEQLFDAAVAAIAQGRQKSAQEVRAWIDQGPYTAADALAKGLVDGVLDGEELEEELAHEGEEKIRLVPLQGYRGPKVLGWPRYKRLRARPAIGLVRIEGIIKLGESVQLPWARSAGSDTVIQALRRAREDRRVRAIVLAIDSRGGSALASELVARAVRRAAEKKPVVAYIDHVAASGGYMAAAGASTIVAAGTAITGSIGVFGGKFELSGLLDKLGVGRAALKLGAHAALESAFAPWTDEERAALDHEIEQTYRDFLQVVATGRKKTPEEIEPLAGGRIYTGWRAQEVGLVDELGSFEDAVARAAALAGLKGTLDVVPIEVAAKGLSALSGLRGLADAWDLLGPLSRERAFAFDESGVRITPEP